MDEAAVYTALKAERDRLQRALDGWEADALREANNAKFWRQRERKLRAALEPFTRNVNAVSLAEALGHI
jgi:hypothetical protein